VNSLAYRTVDAPSRTLWTNTHADGKTVPACSRVRFMLLPCEK
jgi:hypothetical protein